METQIQTQLQTQPETTQLTKMDQTYTTYLDYNNVRLSCTPSEQKTIPGTGQQANPPSPPQHFYQIPLLYNFGTSDNRVLNEFLFEGCEMHSPYGVQSKPGQSGRVEHSIMCRFDGNNFNDNKFIESIGQLHGACGYILHQMKGAVKLYNFNKDMAEATGLKNPIYRARDEMTGEIIQGRAPSMFLKLFSRGKPPMVEQTLFTDLNEKPIPWNLLQGVELKFIPLIHIKRIYVGGGKASIQMEVVSAIVTSIHARNTTTRQMTTLHHLKESRPDLPDLVSAQLAKIALDRQDQMVDNSTANNNHNNEPQNQPTYSGIVSTNQPTYSGVASTNQQTYPQQTYPQQAYQQQTYQQQTSSSQPGVLPNIPSLNQNQNNMQDFTGAAPTRNGVIPTVPVPGLNQKTPSPGIEHQATDTLQLN